MARRLKLAAAVATASLLSTLLTTCAVADGPSDQAAIQTLQEDVAIAAILDRLRAVPVAEVTILRDVRIVDPVDATVVAGQSLVVANGKITAVTALGKEPSVEGAKIIEGGGRFVSPGLVDMHVHSHWASAWLLDLAHGVTTVREMDGFPWLLDVRARAADGRMLAPTLFVAGTIINAFDLDGYAVVPRDAADARRIVGEQAVCGYDFIKVHNVLQKPVFDAVADEAAKRGKDLVGHVPHDMTIRYAVEHGMRTLEHLKGFIDDKTLQLGDTDYAAAAVPNVWVTPTLYAGRGFASVEAQRAMLSEPGMSFIPARRRAGWAADIQKPADDMFKLSTQGEDLRRQITRRLAATPGIRFLAGTDAAFYTYGVMGAALIEELKLLQQNGLSPQRVVRAATSEPAEAMRVPNAFGRIRPGMRADLVLLAANPLDDVTAYRHNAGVMVRGRWLDRDTLDKAIAELAAIYARDPSPQLTHDEAAALAAHARALAASGFVFAAPILLEGADALRRTGHADAAAQFAALANAPTTGPCAAPIPR